jgi:drug/metabolite transporter (DMT)-like permease
MSSKKTNNPKPILEKIQVRHYLVLALLLIGGTLFFNLAIQNLTVFNLNLIANFQYIVSICLAIIIYKEQLNKQQILGVFLIFLSIAFSQYFI